MRKFITKLYSSELVSAILILSTVTLFAINTASIPYTTDYSDYEYDESISLDDTTDDTIYGDLPNIESQVVVDENDIKITAIKIDYGSYGGPQVLFQIESNFKTDIRVQVRECSINGYMIEGSFSSDVKSGDSITDPMYLDKSDLELANIEEISQIQLKFKVFHPESYDDILITDLVTLNTNSNYVQTYDDSGKLLYDKNNVKIIMKDLDYSNSVTGPRIPIYIENNNNVSLNVFLYELKINDFVIDEFFTGDMSPGNKLIAYIEYFETPKEAYDIDEFKDIEFDFSFMSLDNYDVYFSTDSIFVTLD